MTKKKSWEKSWAILKSWRNLFLFGSSCLMRRTRCSTVMVRNSGGAENCGVRGFSLIEIMIIIAIIGILSAIATPTYRAYINKAKTVKAISEIKVISYAVDTYRMGKDELPMDLAAVGYGNYMDPWGRPYQYLNIEALDHEPGGGGDPGGGGGDPGGGGGGNPGGGGGGNPGGGGGGNRAWWRWSGGGAVVIRAPS